MSLTQLVKSNTEIDLRISFWLSPKVQCLIFEQICVVTKTVYHGDCVPLHSARCCYVIIVIWLQG